MSKPDLTRIHFDRDVLKTLAPQQQLIGCDEVGRGSLIGPIVAAAVCFPASFWQDSPEWMAQLNDSKQLKPQLRAELASLIQSHCAFGIGEATHHEINQINVHHASLLAMARAVQQLKQHPLHQQKQQDQVLPEDFLLIDGRSIIPDWPKSLQKAVIKGDSHSASIAAASIVAKEHRDTWVKNLAKEYPGYGWETNMGYPTPPHQRALSELGITEWHRKNYKTVQAAQLALDLVTQ